jgi:hypothetical protein
MIATVLMIRVYLEVRSKSRQASRWKFNAKLKSKDNASNDANLKNGSWLLSVLSFFRRLTSKTERHGDSMETTEITDTTNGGITQNKAAPRSKKPTKKTSLEDQVFWQSCLYLGAFYLSWTLILIACIASLYPEGNLKLYPFYLTALILSPLQGFWNSVIYFRPRLAARRSTRLQSPSRPQVSSSMLAKVRQWLGSTRPSSEDTEYVDPSDQIAVSAGRWNYGPVLSDKTSAMQDGSTGVGNHNSIGEEVPELEGAENRIQDNLPDESAEM